MPPRPARSRSMRKSRANRALGYIVENRLIQSVLWNALKQANVALRVPAKWCRRTSMRNVACSRSTTEHRCRAGSSSRRTARNPRCEKWPASTVRERNYDQRAIVAHVTTERAHESTAWQRFLPHATLAFLPLGDGRSSIVWSAPADDSRTPARARRCGVLPRTRCGVRFPSRQRHGDDARVAIPLRLLLAKRYIAPRLALAGDAAHVVHPLAGQGVNLGLRDAAEMADALIDARDAKRDFAADFVLRRYERRRRSDDSLSAYAFDGIQRVFGSDCCRSPSRAASRCRSSTACRR